MYYLLVKSHLDQKICDVDWLQIWFYIIWKELIADDKVTSSAKDLKCPKKTKKTINCVKVCQILTLLSELEVPKIKRYVN